VNQAFRDRADDFIHSLRIGVIEELAALEPNRTDLRDKVEVYLNEVPVALGLLARMVPRAGRRVLGVSGA